MSREVDLERRSVKSQDSVEIWSDFSGLPRGYPLERSEKVIGGQRGLKSSGS